MVRRDVEAGGRRRASRDALTSHPQVERLLEAARSPAGPRELAREDEAVDLFHRARLAQSAPAPSSRSARAGFKAVAASVAAVVAMSSGVAFAATGHLPFAGSQQRLGPASADHGRGRAAGPRDDASSSSFSSSSAAADTSPRGPATQALQGLCRAYSRAQKATHGHALEAPPFTALVAAAGGGDHVADFCAALAPHGRPGTPPTQPIRPSHSPVRPSHSPVRPSHSATHSTEPSNGATHPSQGPESHPTRPAHPTGGASPTKPTHPGPSVGDPQAPQRSRSATPRAGH